MCEDVKLLVERSVAKCGCSNYFCDENVIYGDYDKVPEGKDIASLFERMMALFPEADYVFFNAPDNVLVYCGTSYVVLELYNCFGGTKCDNVWISGQMTPKLPDVQARVGICLQRLAEDVKQRLSALPGEMVKEIASLIISDDTLAALAKKRLSKKTLEQLAMKKF